MRQRVILLALFVFLVGSHSFVQGQATDALVKPSVVIGEVSTVSKSKMILQTKDGAVDVALSEKTEYKRVSPEKPSLATAVASNFSDIGVGDKVIVTGILATDKKSIPAKSIYLMTKSDIAQKQTKEQEQWKTRGISGQVTAVNPPTKEITVTSRGMTGETKTLLTTKENAVFRRYAQDSISYNEAKTSSLDEIKVGDSIRALGDKSTDGASFKAEEIISGSFQTIGGTITAIDPVKNEITIENIQTKKVVTVIVGQNSVLKQFPAEMAQRLAAFQNGGGMQPPSGGVRPPNQSAANQTGGQTPPNGMRPGGGMRSGGGGGIDEMLERFPNITLADLKVGGMIAFSSSKGTNQERVTAIKLLSGVEPFLNTPQAGNNGGRRGGQAGANSGFSIPGLEGGGNQ
jgi:ribosomal protein L24